VQPLASVKSLARGRREDDADTSDDTGTLDEWDPHAGLKPSASDDRGSDADIELEDDLPYGADEDVRGAMLDLMIELEDSDARDTEWLPPREQQKLAARKTGDISFPSSRPEIRDLKLLRETEVPLSWPRHYSEIRTNTTTPETH
jgi:hypothetical protein